MAKVVDCFMFFDEFDALTIRLHELAPVVDHFVLVEASTTHSGTPKPFYFTERADEFRDFVEQMIVVQVTDLPSFQNRWIAEHMQRNAIIRGLQGIDAQDIVIISDCDEIPRASCVTALADHLVNEGDVTALEMAAFYYALNLRSPQKWDSSRATRRGTLDFMTPQEVRTTFTAERVPNAGWHFSYLASNAERVSKISRKAAAFAHREFDHPLLTSDEHLGDAVANDELWWKASGPAPEHALLHRVQLDDSFPRAVRADPDRWQDFVVPGAGDPRYEWKYRWEKSKRDLRRGARLLRESSRSN